MEINGALLSFLCLPKLFWAVLSSAVCGDTVNEEERGDVATAGLIQNSAPDRPTLPHNKEEAARAPSVTVSNANLLKCLRVTQLTNLSNQGGPRCAFWYLRGIDSQANQMTKHKNKMKNLF